MSVLLAALALFSGACVAAFVAAVMDADLEDMQ